MANGTLPVLLYRAVLPPHTADIPNLHVHTIPCVRTPEQSQEQGVQHFQVSIW